MFCKSLYNTLKSAFHLSTFHMHNYNVGCCVCQQWCQVCYNTSMMCTEVDSTAHYAGVFIDYYGGEAVNHITQYSARLYFVCKAGTKLEGPTLEHVKDSYTAHFRFNTEYVC